VILSKKNPIQVVIATSKKTSFVADVKILVIGVYGRKIKTLLLAIPPLCKSAPSLAS
jgi:hypothetical protein